MPTLNWIGKDAVVNHHLTVPFRLLKDVPELSCGDPGSGNLIVEGDNLVALKALLPYYAGQVKCIYIDPPYNTGNEGWAYNDNVNSPLIREWIGKAVGKEGETLDRHDRWLCMMYPRLALLKEFLREDGAIFVSIDDNEAATLRLVMDEIFGSFNFLANVVWEKADSPKMDSEHFSSRHDQTLVFARNIKAFSVNRILDPNEIPSHYNKTDSEGRQYYLKPLRAMMGGEEERREARPSMYFGILAPDGTEVFPKLPDGSDGRWRWGVDKVENEKSRIEWVKGKKGWTPYFRIYADTSTGRPPETIFTNSFAGGSRTAKAEIKAILPTGKTFTTPKPTQFIGRILEIATDKDSLVLDSFAGSGTTAHAVLKKNKEDGGERKFILVEMDPSISKMITRERIKRTVEGYRTKKELQPGLGGGFRYCQLGEPLFDETGEIRKSVSFTDLARHVWFTETGEPLPRERVRRNPFLGDFRGAGIYLLYNGILADKSPEGGNVLTRSILADLPSFDGPRVIYCAGCRIGADRLRREGITIRQTPYEIKVS